MGCIASIRLFMLKAECPYTLPRSEAEADVLHASSEDVLVRLLLSAARLSAARLLLASLQQQRSLAHQEHTRHTSFRLFDDDQDSCHLTPLSLDELVSKH